MIEFNNTTAAVLRNQQWSVTALMDVDNPGTVLERYAYDKFGKRTILTPNGANVRAESHFSNFYGYTSRRHDVETGLMYFRARYYDPATSEFISRDPMEYVDGMSLYRGYFVPGATDPGGTKTCKLRAKQLISISVSLGPLLSTELPVGAPVAFGGTPLKTAFCKCEKHYRGTYECSERQFFRAFGVVPYCPAPILINTLEFENFTEVVDETFDRRGAGTFFYTTLSAGAGWANIVGGVASLGEITDPQDRIVALAGCKRKCAGQ